MDVTLYVMKEYERNDIFAVPENKANSNPLYFVGVLFADA